jgi:hypothetical protein
MLQIWLRSYQEGWAAPTKGSREAVAQGRANSALGAYGVVEVRAFRKWLETQFFAMDGRDKEQDLPRAMSVSAGVRAGERVGDRDRDRDSDSDSDSDSDTVRATVGVLPTPTEGGMPTAPPESRVAGPAGQAGPAVPALPAPPAVAEKPARPPRSGDSRSSAARREVPSVRGAAEEGEGEEAPVYLDGPDGAEDGEDAEDREETEDSKEADEPRGEAEE